MALLPHRLRAPAIDGGVLSEPPLDQAGELLRQNATRFGHDWRYDFQGRDAQRLRSMAHQQVLARSREWLASHGIDPPLQAPVGAPLIVTGHQPELFHPGVWIKNFAIAHLARLHGGVALNLVIDNDIPKSAAIRMPRREHDEFRQVDVEFDVGAGETPFEDWDVGDERAFESFGGRVRESLAGAIPDPLIDDVWSRVPAVSSGTRHVGTRLTLARRSFEASIGMHNCEIPLSEVCETDSFRWFASHLLAHLPRFQQVHNAALGRYRALYHIRSRNHPVPALSREGEWLESPFWVWRRTMPRRRPLLARQLERTMQLRIAGEDSPLAELSLAPGREACCAVEQMRDLAASGVRIRTRALTTTMFARLILSDLFLHGIGGAKYDELGDEIVREFFGIDPPGYQTLSMTLWLGLPFEPAAAQRFHAVEAALRSLTYNPDRALVESRDSTVRAWIDAKRDAVVAPVTTRRDRVERWRSIRRCNLALQPAVQQLRAQFETQRAGLAAVLRRDQLTRARDYSYVLHSRERLLNAMGRVAPAAFGG